MRHKRIVVTRYGGPEVITLIDEDTPVPKTGDGTGKGPFSASPVVRRIITANSSISAVCSSVSRTVIDLSLARFRYSALPRSAVQAQWRQRHVRRGCSAAVPEDLR